MADNSSLPDPDPDALERSRRVADLIRSEMADAGGRLSFERYMQLALYADEVGYYVSGAPIFGADGDFVTAPESGELFARCLARQCAEVLATTGGVVVEYGAGSGALALSLLASLREEGVTPGRYLIVEPSPALAAQQRAMLGAALPRDAPKVEWFTDHPGPSVRGVVIANEVLDAMPVERFCIGNGAARALDVVCDGDGFAWQTGTREVAANAALGQLLQTLGDGYCSEFNTRLGDWFKGLRGVLREGVAFVIDYGYPRHEYLHPSRRDGTLKCHYRHHVHDNPFVYPGLQDITAAVDFTTVAEAAADAGFAVAGYTSQARFLLASGLESHLAVPGDAVRQFELAQEAKRLLLPSEMGQICRVMALAAGRVPKLAGFADDERHRLSGFAPA